MTNIKLIVSDVDGVWTDGSFYYSKKGDSLRKFNTKDSYGVSLANYAGLRILMISGSDKPMVLQRMQSLGIKDAIFGTRKKLLSLRQYCEKNELSLKEVAFLGDDMNDYNITNEVGFFACPADACSRIKKKSKLILQKKGGEGAFREFVEHILSEKGILEAAYNAYINEH